MTTNHAALRGRPVELDDGTHVVVWSEEEAAATTIVVNDIHGREVGRLRAQRLRGDGAAELTVWTERPMRRRGIARLACTEAVEWAQRCRIPYLVGETSGVDPAARAFLTHCGFVVAIRSWAGSAKFAILVPGATARPVVSATFEHAIAALEAGASLAEAEAVYDRLVAA